MEINQQPSNFVAEVNGHHIYRDDRIVGRILFHLYTPGVGWWAFDLQSEDRARQTCQSVSAPGRIQAKG